jgi:hypothetical protein
VYGHTYSDFIPAVNRHPSLQTVETYTALYGPYAGTRMVHTESQAQIFSMPTSQTVLSKFVLKKAELEPDNNKGIDVLEQYLARGLNINELRVWPTPELLSALLRPSLRFNMVQQMSLIYIEDYFQNAMSGVVSDRELSNWLVRFLQRTGLRPKITFGSRPKHSDSGFAPRSVLHDSNHLPSMHTFLSGDSMHTSTTEGMLFYSICNSPSCETELDIRASYDVFWKDWNATSLYLVYPAKSWLGSDSSFRMISAQSPRLRMLTLQAPRSQSFIGTFPLSRETVASLTRLLSLLSDLEAFSIQGNRSEHCEDLDADQAGSFRELECQQGEKKIESGNHRGREGDNLHLKHNKLVADFAISLKKAFPNLYIVTVVFTDKGTHQTYKAKIRRQLLAEGGNFEVYIAAS